jgi:hypothetical protein
MPRIEHPIIDTAESVAGKGPLSGTDHSVIRVPELDVAIPWYQARLSPVPNVGQYSRSGARGTTSHVRSGTSGELERE